MNSIYNAHAILFSVITYFKSFFKQKNEIIVPSRKCDVRCKCHGYNNYTCEPIQCAENTATCTPDGRSYQCVCNPGYEGDGITCASNYFITKFVRLLTLPFKACSNPSFLPIQSKSINLILFIEIFVQKKGFY